MANNLSAKFFKLLCTADTDGLFGKACDLVKTDGREPSERAILDGLAVLTNKHPARGWEGPSMVRGRFACPSCGWGLDDDGCRSAFCDEGGVSNDFAQLDTTRAAGRARQRAGLLHLFADRSDRW